MAKNRKFADGRKLSLVCSQPASPVSGNPVLCGQIPGVALTDERTDGTTSVDTAGVYELTAEAVDGAGNSAIAVGDILYYDAAATIKINKDVTNGVRFGYALTAVSSGASGAINVRLGY